jgi:hypothetical protein
MRLLVNTIIFSLAVIIGLNSASWETFQAPAAESGWHFNAEKKDPQKTPRYTQYTLIKFVAEGLALGMEAKDDNLDSDDLIGEIQALALGGPHSLDRPSFPPLLDFFLNTHLSDEIEPPEAFLASA